MAADEDLAMVFSAPEGDLRGAGLEDEIIDEVGDEEEFRSAIVDAFPDLEGKDDRIAAMKQAIEACVRQYGG